MTKILDEALAPSHTPASVQPAQPLVRSEVDRPTGLVRKRRGLSSTKLGVDVDRLLAAGWYCHWINDTPGRVEDLQDLGYVFVLPHEIGPGDRSAPASADGGNRVSRRVGTKEDGSVLLAYLMKTSREFKSENDEYTQLPCDKIDAQIRSGVIKQKAGEDGSASVDPESKTHFYRNEAVYNNPRSR